MSKVQPQIILHTKTQNMSPISKGKDNQQTINQDDAYDFKRDPGHNSKHI